LEAAIHTALSLFGSDELLAVLKTDAFNECSHTAFSDHVSEDFPEIFCWVP